MNRTRIVATIGPASDAPETIDALLDAGLDVARVNCAHGTPEERAARIRLLRARAARRERPLAILADLGGPKLRIGRIAGGVADLRAGDAFTLTTAAVLGDATQASIDDPDLPGDVAIGDPIFLNDGLVQLRVTAARIGEIHTRIEVGGPIGDHKGLAVPAAPLRLASLTTKDLSDLDALAADPPDFVGLSFVRSASDVERLRRELATRGIAAAIVAKIEKAQAVEQLDAIVAASDAVMVARGDLGVECPIAEVPVLQKRIVRTCNQAAIPVITATQMLESMIGSPRPTRAEASDVANAVLDGSDAVMLSGETAVGRFPVHAVRTMAAIAGETERYAAESARPPERRGLASSIAAAIGHAATFTAEALDAAAILCLTRSGATARAIARWRPRRPIVVATPSAATWRALALTWGVEPRLVADFGDDFESACKRILGKLVAEGRLAAGAAVVVTAGLPFAAQGKTNTVRVEVA